MRLTKKRKLVLEKIKNSEQPLNAEAIYKKIDPKEIDLSTVYRALEYLSKHKLINSMFVKDTFYYYFEDSKHHHYLVCENCGNMSSVDCHLQSTIKNIEAKNNFKIKSHDVVFYGLCSNCYSLD